MDDLGVPLFQDTSNSQNNPNLWLIIPNYGAS